MRVTSAILFLIAFAVNMAAGSSATKDLAGKKGNLTIDTIKNNEVFLLASILTKNKSEELTFMQRIPC